MDSYRHASRLYFLDQEFTSWLGETCHMGILSMHHSDSLPFFRFRLVLQSLLFIRWACFPPGTPTYTFGVAASVPKQPRQFVCVRVLRYTATHLTLVYLLLTRHFMRSVYTLSNGMQRKPDVAMGCARLSPSVQNACACFKPPEAEETSEEH